MKVDVHMTSDGDQDNMEVSPHVGFNEVLKNVEVIAISDVPKHTKTQTLRPQEEAWAGEQHQCHAHTMSGQRCPNMIVPGQNIPLNCDRPIPLCPTCSRDGDAAVMTVEHPIVGRCLVARFNLPKNYALYYFGDRKKDSEITDDEPAADFVFDFKSKWVIDPIGVETSHGLTCQLRFANSPGPRETHNMNPTDELFGRHDSPVVANEFRTTLPVPAGTQLLWQYDADGWFSCRGIKRCDMGAEGIPCPRKGAYRRYYAQRRAARLRTKQQTTLSG